ncbi:DUF302 domain-containing protein [bacterium AH-315-F03]|nr:DUF302 domain-containing protein [bacterium AH-315-F03]
MEQTQLITRVKTSKSFDATCEELEALCPEKMFRVLAVHDVQETLKDKGFNREPLRIIEICNAGFANDALKIDQDVSLFMPCKFVVADNGGATTITLGRPSVISQMLDSPELEKLACDVEERLEAIMLEVAG